MKQAPDFRLTDHEGKTHTLGSYAGKWIVLYFYPKDDTPGCTTEACSFRDARELISQLGNAEVVGISKDSTTSHKTIEAYGSWKPLKFMGRDYMGTQRNTFLINPVGLIAKQYEGVDPKTHVA